MFFLSFTVLLVHVLYIQVHIYVAKDETLKQGADLLTWTTTPPPPTTFLYE